MRWVILALAMAAAPAYAQSPSMTPNDYTLNGVPHPSPAQGGDAPGLAVDSAGNPVVDPTKNVLDLVRAESKYQDAMRDAESKLAEVRAEYLEQIGVERSRRQDDLRKADAELAALRTAAAIQRSNDLRDAAEKLIEAQIGAVNERAALSLASAGLLRDTETKRVNDVLAVTAKALETANAAATETAKTLATQVQSLATGLASQVDAAATATANNLARVEERIAAAQAGLGDRLTVLEQFQNQGLGRQAVADPAVAAQIADLGQTVRDLAEERAIAAGQDKGQAATIAFIFAGLGALVGLGGLLFAVLGGKKENQIVYVPSAPGMPPVTASPTPSA